MPFQPPIKILLEGRKGLLWEVFFLFSEIVLGLRSFLQSKYEFFVLILFAFYC